MSDDLKAAAIAVDALNKGFEEFKKANDQRLAEIEKKGKADPILEEKLSKIEADIQRAQALADEAALEAKRSQRVRHDGNGNEIDLDKKAFDWADAIARKRGTRATGFDAKAMDEYKAAFEVYIRKGDRGVLTDGEYKALSVGSDPDGGYVVYPDMSGRVVMAVNDTSPMRAYASVQVISTNELKGLHDLENAGSGWVAETDARTETATPQVAPWTIPVHDLYANAPATQQILDDAAINMEQWLGDKIGTAFALEEATAFVTGNGTGKPKGFLTYAAGTTNPGQIEQIKTGVDGDLGAAPDAGDVLINALYSLKQQYRANAAWFMNRATTALVRKAKDSDGAYIWQPGVAAGQPATLLGYPVAAFEDMPNPATGSLSIAVGDMRAAYQIVDRQGIRTLRDPYTNKPYVLFYSTKRVGGAVVNFEAIKLIDFSA